MEKKLGKISEVRFGLGGYKDLMLGLHLGFTFEGSGVGTSICACDANMIEHNESSTWTEENRSKQYDEIMRKVSDLLHQSKVDSIEKLKGIPVEVIIESNTFKDFRILTEVL